MNRAEFMRQLENLLQNISRTEREEALQYYNDYFDDAGAEKEQEVIEALGNPARVAETIKRDLTVNGMGAGGSERQDNRYEHGYREEDGQGNSVRHPVAQYKPSEDGMDGGRTSDRESAQKTAEGAERTGARENEMPAWQLALLIVGGILLAPVAFGLASTLAGALVGLVTGWFSLILGFGAAAIALFLLLVALVVIGCLCLWEAPLAGIAIVGGGLICGGLGILFLMLTVAMAGIVTPAIWKGCKKLWRMLIGKRKKEALI